MSLDVDVLATTYEVMATFDMTVTGLSDWWPLQSVWFLVRSDCYCSTNY